MRQELLLAPALPVLDDIMYDELLVRGFLLMLALLAALSPPCLDVLELLVLL